MGWGAEGALVEPDLLHHAAPHSQGVHLQNHASSIAEQSAL